MNVLIATEKPFSAKAVAEIKRVLTEAGHTPVLLEKYTSADELRAAAATADALIVRSDIVDEALFAAAPNLKIVVRAGAGYDNIDLKAATAAGAIVENTPGQNSRAVAELVIGMAIMAARNSYDGTTGFEISGKRLGLQAFGQVSRHVAAIARGFGMEVKAIDPYCPVEVMADAGVGVAESVPALYGESDIVSIHLKAATAAGAIVENTPGQNSRAVAELVIGMAIMAARNSYDGTTGFEISGKRLGLQAFGQVSRHVAAIARGFGMEVKAIDPYCPVEVMADAGVGVAESVPALYGESDIVSIHIPATPETTGSIGRDLISRMPKGAVLINTARKEVINETELEEVLRERPDIKYFADVKPKNADALVEQFGKRVFFTPKKSGAQTAEANLNAGVAAARQIVAFFADGTDRFRVN